MRSSLILPFALGSARTAVRLAVFIAAMTARSAPAQATFTDVSTAAGLTDQNMRSMNIHGLGVTWFDFDADGWDDMFVVNGKGFTKELYRNRCDGTFELRNDLLPTFPDVEMMGAVAGDYDNDGDVVSTSSPTTRTSDSTSAAGTGRSISCCRTS